MNRDKGQHECSAPYWPRAAMGIFFLAIAFTLFMEKKLEWGDWICILSLTLLGVNVLLGAWRKRNAWIDKIGSI